MNIIKSIYALPSKGTIQNRYICSILRYYSSNKNDVNEEEELSPRMREFRRKLSETTPVEGLKLNEIGEHPHQEQEPLEPWPNNTNPHTGEIGGPRGPEPTRYGDWERKGRVSDF